MQHKLCPLQKTGIIFSFNIFLSLSSPGKLFVLQLAVWSLRGVARVILANNPLSGALILAALYWASPWQGLLGTLGVLASTLTAVIIGQDRWKHMNIHTATNTLAHRKFTVKTIKALEL